MIDVTQHLGLANVIARRCGARAIGANLDFDDLMQEAAIGLMQAAARFDPERGVKFGTYAAFWIRHEVTRYVEDESVTIRTPVHAQHKRRKRGERSRASVHYLDAPLETDTGEGRVTHGDMTSYAPGQGLASEPDESEAQILALVARTPALTEKQRQVMTMRARGVSLKEIGATWGVSRERARQVQEDAILRIREQLVRDGVLETVEVPRVIAQRLETQPRELQRQRRKSRAA